MLCTCAAGLASGHGAELRSVAVLSPYKAQVALLQRRFRARAPLLDRVEFGTVDGFQVRRSAAHCIALPHLPLRAHARGVPRRPRLACQCPADEQEPPCPKP